MKKILILLACVCLGITIYWIGTNKNADNQNKKTKQFLEELMNEKLEKEVASIYYYAIYGQSLNLKGNLEIDTENISDISLVMLSDNSEKNFEIFYTTDVNKISFSTFEKINNGLLLDSLDLGNYILALKVTVNINDSDETANTKEINKYYSIANNSGYGNADYYTITNDSTNNLISIEFKTYEEDKQYMSFNVTKASSMDNIYDIIIDPGHGGKDSGAINGNYYEANIALECAKIIKERLEESGFKVKLTRENSTDTVNIYDAGGRVALPYETKAKYLFSIHLNSSTVKTIGGIEVYAPNESDLTLAKNISDALASLTSFGYSKNKSYRVDNGVYVKNFDNYLKTEIEKVAQERGFEPYFVDSNTPYLFMIRETGGISTHAYVDGRDSRYSVNKYYKSNIGTEAYLIEIGYLSNMDELNNIINNQDKYASQIAESIINYLSNKK